MGAAAGFGTQGENYTFILMTLHLVNLSLLAQPEDVCLMPPPRPCLLRLLQLRAVYLLAISASLVEMQAPVPLESLMLPGAGALGSCL